MTITYLETENGNVFVKENHRYGYFDPTFKKLLRETLGKEWDYAKCMWKKEEKTKIVEKSLFPEKSTLRIPSSSKKVPNPHLMPSLRNRYKRLFKEIFTYITDEFNDTEKKVVTLGLDSANYIVAKQYMCTKENCNCVGYWWDGNKEEVSSQIDLEGIKTFFDDHADEIISKYIHKGHGLWSHLR